MDGLHPGAEAALCAADPELGALVARVGPCGLEVRPVASMCEALVRAIVHQQLSGRAAATITGRVEALGRSGFPSAAELLALDEQRLRGAGLSRAKLAAVRDVAARAEAGALPTLDDGARLDDDALVDALLAVRGVGRWTVEMVLMFRLGRPDVLPVHDLGVRKGFQRTFGGASLPAPEVLLARGERWRPWRSVASWYLWRAAEGG